MDEKWGFYLTELIVSGTVACTAGLMKPVLLFYTLLVSMVTGQVGVPALCVMIAMMPWYRQDRYERERERLAGTSSVEWC